MQAPTIDPLQLLEVADVAALVKMSPRWVEEQHKAGALVAHRCGDRLRFSRADVEAFQASLRETRKPVVLAAVVEMRKAS